VDLSFIGLDTRPIRLADQKHKNRTGPLNYDHVTVKLTTDYVSSERGQILFAVYSVAEL